jgi:hypothetical protein
MQSNDPACSSHDILLVRDARAVDDADLVNRVG